MTAFVPEVPVPDQVLCGPNGDDRYCANFWSQRGKLDLIRGELQGLLDKVTHSADATRPSRKSQIEDEFADALRSIIEEAES